MEGNDNSPWIAETLVVLMVLGLAAYTAYIYYNAFVGVK